MPALSIAKCGFLVFVAFRGAGTKLLSSHGIVRDLNLRCHAYNSHNYILGSGYGRGYPKQTHNGSSTPTTTPPSTLAGRVEGHILRIETMNMSSSVFESIKIVFSTLLRFLKRWNTNRFMSQAPENPYPFGTREWRIFADAQANEHEVMVLRIADLEAQVEQTTELVDSLEALAASQDTLIRDLRLQNKALLDGPDPEILQRILDDIHTPMRKPSKHGGAEPRPAHAKSDVPSSGPVASVAGSTHTSRRDPNASSQGTAAAHSTARLARPLTLAEELEGHLGQDSEDESEL